MTWTPDNRLAFVFLEAPDYETAALYTMKRNGGHRRLILKEKEIGAPSWSSKGDLAIGAPRRGLGISLVTPNGLHSISDPSGVSPALFDPDLSWSPDGSRIVFSRDDGGNYSALGIMNADGSELAGIACGEPAFYPAWSPMRALR